MQVATSPAYAAVDLAPDRSADTPDGSHTGIVPLGGDVIFSEVGPTIPLEIEVAMNKIATLHAQFNPFLDNISKTDKSEALLTLVFAVAELALGENARRLTGVEYDPFWSKILSMWLKGRALKIQQWCYRQISPLLDKVGADNGCKWDI